MADSVWAKLAKKGYLGDKAKVAAQAGADPMAWGSGEDEEKKKKKKKKPEDY